jgi:poly(3-hydroxybutyrate) depolymerase
VIVFPDAGTGSGCGNTSAKTGDFTVSVTIAGVARTYEVLVSSNYDPNTPVPLIFVFHGAGAKSSDAKAFGLQNAAKTAGNPAVFVFPQGVSQGSDGVGWNLKCNGADVTFFDTMRAALESQYCIQIDRVFVTGFSWGGDFTNALGCCRGDVVRGIAPGSGGWYVSGCTAKAPAFRLTSGTADPNYAQSDFMASYTYFHTANHCTDTQTSVSPSPCKGYTGCDQPVDWCSYSGMGHSLPSDWPTATWSFFSDLQ